jgi:3-hydroxybutyryl-CoA dehydratase
MEPAPAATYAWHELAVGMAEQATLRFTRAELLQFAELSGDRNPLHLDPVFPRERGFSREIVYAGLIFARLSGLLGMRLPGRDGVWISSNLDFPNPLYVDEEAELTAEIIELSDAVRTVTLRIRVRAGSRVIVRGTALVTLCEARA